MRSDASQTHVEASALQDAQQLSARHADPLRHEIFHQTKAEVKGALAGRAERCFTRTDTKHSGDSVKERELQEVHQDRSWSGPADRDESREIKVHRGKTKCTALSFPRISVKNLVKCLVKDKP
ncbi:hypothetical protein VZT92_020209 [Zoarces viviparus]|uniref:Uncharacterized protein n=1 Tax=Zoarces viviparus TaxID=48416 RepID=A0AAW1EDM5_ZOAVI